MRRFLKLILFLFLILPISNAMYAQSKKLSIDDQLLQDSIYKSNKKKVLNFSMKEFDALFFEYFTTKNDANIVLTKTEFYKYTVQIATFSDRLAKLYPEQKEVAAKNKEQWLSESYEDYLQFKASQKK
jgi:putative cell wall-binding protein